MQRKKENKKNINSKRNVGYAEGKGKKKGTKNMMIIKVASVYGLP